MQEQPSMRRFLSNIRNLDKIIRFSTMARLKDETVAEHSFHAAFYAMMLADFEIKAGNKVDVEKVLRSALLHDVEEVVTGDVIHGFKYSDPELAEKMKRMGHEFFKKLLEDVPELSELYLKFWRESKDDSIEGKIVDAADKLEALTYSMEEYSLGNKNFKPVIDHVLSRLKSSELKSVEIFLKDLKID